MSENYLVLSLVLAILAGVSGALGIAGRGGAKGRVRKWAMLYTLASLVSGFYAASWPGLIFSIVTTLFLLAFLTFLVNSRHHGIGYNPSNKDHVLHDAGAMSDFIQSSDKLDEENRDYLLAINKLNTARSIARINGDTEKEKAIAKKMSELQRSPR